MRVLHRFAILKRPPVISIRGLTSRYKTRACRVRASGRQVLQRSAPKRHPKRSARLKRQFGAAQRRRCSNGPKSHPRRQLCPPFDVTALEELAEKRPLSRPLSYTVCSPTRAERTLAV